MRWHQKPLALIGSMKIAYHEVLRGRRTGICQDCGRLTHATTMTCLCGGPVEATDPPGKHIDDTEAAEYDTLAKPANKATVYSILLLIGLSILVGIEHMATTGSPTLAALIGWVAMLFGALAAAL